MTDPVFGTLDGEGERRNVHFSRHFLVPPEEVWDAITEPARMGRWLADATIDLQVGGAVELRFEPGDPDQTVTGRILACRPPTLLEYEWHWPGENQSVVRFDLSPEANGTLLVLTHRLLPAPAAAGYAAGWHAYLDLLAGVFGAPRPEWLARFQEVKPDYDRAVALGR
jgi:uncharacterized protein YndB with AHSA1/START domain